MSRPRRRPSDDAIELDDTRAEEIGALDDTVADEPSPEDNEQSFQGDLGDGGLAGEGSIFETGVAELESQIAVEPVSHGAAAATTRGAASEVAQFAGASHQQRLQNSFTKLLIMTGLLMASIAMAILAAILHDLWLIITASVMFPVFSVLWYKAYAQWQANKRFGFRLLESLGEDVSDVAIEDRYKKPRRH